MISPCAVGAFINYRAIIIYSVWVRSRLARASELWNARGAFQEAFLVDSQMEEGRNVHLAQEMNNRFFAYGITLARCGKSIA